MALVDIDPIQSWLVQQGLVGNDELEMLTGFCARCNEAGLGLVHAVIFVDTLHPVLESWGFHWDAEAGKAETQPFPRSAAADNADRWRASPFFHMQLEGNADYRVDLTEQVSDRFPILTELREAGHTGYFAMIHPLSGDDAIGEMDNLFSRWSTTKPGGFTDDDIAVLRDLVPALALAIKTAALRHIAQSLVSAYLGRDPGRRVLEGRISRGSLESINTVLWYSDLVSFTAISEKVDSATLIALLNDYAEAAILSVTENGGDVLKLVGDGILAIFSSQSLSDAALASLEARRKLVERVALLNQQRQSRSDVTTDIYLALHVGEVFYGNIGSAERLDFTVIGPAVNEVCRIASTSTATGGSLVVSSEFLALLPQEARIAFVDAGVHHLKGVSQPKQLYISRGSSHA
ncbi:adenylate/guanylate cyclase domain-containing protein [Agrobacterium genomosp. 13]|uniref:Adenylate/guanylate cyclase n=1 Tax=Agrobacterium genomosp. 13 str. CFBP 6927 TaxID=1183428 RepID=A0ABP2BMR9_9HYPH|nr:adenylate/guanylate cyclase domain-containing protein [Agrobacterium genomosp. 13]CUX57961.1 Adenylate/guanylate cyclase [Agrobacterium genomosp. 13 str. CFBP 6927]